MAFEFHKDPKGGPGGISNPFEESNDTLSGKHDGGFSFGSPSESKRSPTGFQFTSEKNRNTSGSGFSNLPTRYNPDQHTIFPGRREHRRTPSKRIQNIDIPWKTILYFLLFAAVICLIAIFWEEIVNVIYNLIALLIALIVLVLLLKILFRRRR